MYSADELRNKIFYWMEVNYFDCKISYLIEESDEAGEAYELDRWESNDQDGTENSLMDVHVLLEQAGYRCAELWDEVNSEFPELLRQCMAVFPTEVYGNYAGIMSDDEILKIADEFFEEPIDTYYAYDEEGKWKNFCELVQRCCGEVIDK